MDKEKNESSAMYRFQQTWSPLVLREGSLACETFLTASEKKVQKLGLEFWGKLSMFSTIS